LPIEESDELLEDDIISESDSDSIEGELNEAIDGSVQCFEVFKKVEGKIIVADDSCINLEALKQNLMEINALSNSVFFIDGQQVIDYVAMELSSH
jgi:PleD family two-component response regulator